MCQTWVATICPEIVPAWHPTLNDNRRPEDYRYHDTTKVYWICTSCGKESFGSIYDKVQSRSPLCKGCKISDHGMDYLPMEDHSEEVINNIFINRKNITEEEKNMFFSHMMRFLAKMYKEKNIIMQIHFATYRNINTKCFNSLGRDAGFDVFRNQVFTDRLAKFFDDLNNIDALPKTILYTLNSNVLKEMIYIGESFRNVKIGPAWWVNDTLLGNKQHLETLAEYSTLGTFLGMLTDSRSFSSYVRFDFFRRILADLIGSYVEKGEYDYNSALKLMEDICYNNIKEFLC